MLAHWEWQKPSIKTFCWCFHLRVGALGEIAWPGKGQKQRQGHKGVEFVWRQRQKQRKGRRDEGGLQETWPAKFIKRLLAVLSALGCCNKGLANVGQPSFLVPWSTAFTRFKLAACFISISEDVPTGSVLKRRFVQIFSRTPHSLESFGIFRMAMAELCRVASFPPAMRLDENKVQMCVPAAGSWNRSEIHESTYTDWRSLPSLSTGWSNAFELLRVLKHEASRCRELAFTRHFRIHLAFIWPSGLLRSVLLAESIWYQKLWTANDDERRAVVQDFSGFLWSASLQLCGGKLRPQSLGLGTQKWRRMRRALRWL